ncbi:peptidoglycan editing factor PgeF [Roseomonas marmotae]|uniref:Purine nucleoside phosphorylase n=1 Tax=Roseomonas marmotae TaxID=2768161 RepID=A0ABS3K9B0_9PROT|nr:peptidoglycan editing factor PgeF [Roseomonas marmotae]MBO1074050.1 peptidoglycan editing factor PgeF [Roseomonas marmotae]QTI78836.1 peptidoglycan editing factor PgeF [Roseomonas marmotae]
MSAEFLTDAALDGLPHGFFTRNGGVSGGAFASLNCSLSGRDDAGAVARNRALAMEAIGQAPAGLCGLFQVHGAAVARVTAPIQPDTRPRADAMVTDRPGLTLGIVTADCGPILFADRKAGVVGAAHAGWRGAVDGVLEATLEAMEELGAHRRDIVAVVGPCIRQPSYEVGPDMRDAAMAQSADAAHFFAPGRREERWQFDLAGYCAARLRAAGAGSVSVVPADTLVEEDRFFSYRRNTLAGGGPIGHQLSAIALPG